MNGYWSCHYREGLDAALQLLSDPDCPAEHRQRFAANARLTLEKLARDTDQGSVEEAAKASPA